MKVALDYFGVHKPVHSLVIIGNGFDLAIGAKTSYESFYNCLKRCFNATSIDSFKCFYASDGNDNVIQSFYQLVHSNKDNYFINYFLNYESIFGSWVSFEKELTKVIKSFDRLVSSLRSNDKLVIEVTTAYGALIYLRMLDCTQLLQVLNVYPDNKFFKAGLESIWLRKDGAARFSIRDKSFRNEYDAYEGIDIFSESFPKLLYKDLTVFSNLFTLYLAIAEHSVRFDSSISKYFDSSYFINYNFTSYLDRVMKKNSLKPEGILYINGQAEIVDGSAKDSIVFGIDSNTKLENLSFEIFTKRIQRSIKNTQVSGLADFLYREFHEILVIGHSLNLADFESLNYIFTQCENNGSPKIVIFYFDDAAKIDLIINLKAILGNDKFDDYQRKGWLMFLESSIAWQDINDLSGLAY